MSRYLEKKFWDDVFVKDRDTRAFLVRNAIQSLIFVLAAFLVVIVDQMTHEDVDIGVTPFEVGGAIVGLLLVMRTNVGITRWWEARQLWGGIVNQCRGLTTAALAYGPPDRAWRTAVVRLTIVFAHASRHRLRGEEVPEAAQLLDEETAQRIKSATHPAVTTLGIVAEYIAEALSRGQIDAFMANQMERERLSLINHLGGCERILNTPLPRGYSVALRQFIVVFVLMLPFGLLQKSGWLTPLITFLVVFPMLVIDEIGAELQNPFSTSNLNHLPLDDICAGIERDLFSLLEDDEIANRPKMGVRPAS